VCGKFSTLFDTTFFAQVYSVPVQLHLARLNRQVFKKVVAGGVQLIYNG